MRAATEDARDLHDLVARRVAGEPLEQVLGWAELAGVRVGLRPGVFVPRRRSTLLVRAALDHLAGTADDRPAVVVDLCCGSGALGLAVASRWGSALDLHAADLDPVAVACARENLDLLGTAHEGDLLDALPADLRGRVDVMVVNAPYVPTAALPLMPREARDHEPVHTLDGGPDGLELHRRVAAGAGSWVRHGGVVLLETSPEQAPGSTAAFDAAAWDTVVLVDDDVAGTCVQATRR